jgi:LysM repeat protein
MYQIYQAADGDTVDSVAARFGIAPEYIFANNDSLPTQFLVPGQSLVIPVGNGILHEVRYGETLTDIATEYDVEPNAILSFPANHLTGPEDLTHTNIIFVPGAHIPAPAASTSPPAPAR